VSTRLDGRAAIRRSWRTDERECVPPLIAEAQLDEAQRARVQTHAGQLIEGLRHHGGTRGIEALIRSFPLSSPAGMALLSLAEALLRVPDSANATRLLRDRLAHIDWQAQPPGGWLRHALWLASRLVQESGPLGTLSAAPARLAARWAIRALAGRFVFAESIDAALRRSCRGSARRYRYSFDMLGEAALNDQDAQRYLQAYEHAIHVVGGAARGRGPLESGSVSVKLSAIHPRYSYSQHGRVMHELLPRLQSLARLARRYDIALTIDAEESDRLEPSLDLIECLLADPDLAAWSGLGVAVQAYQKRAPAVIDHLLHLSAHRPARLLVRLVKGAYWDAEIKLAQTEGLRGFPVYTRKMYTDVAYLACARRLLGAPERVVPQFATHNAQTVAAILELGAGAAPDAFEFQCLYGMGAGLYRQIAQPVRVYAPVGTRPLLLAYLMRRLLENGAASSFVQQVCEPGTSTQRLIADPVERARPLAGSPHPGIVLPGAIFEPERRNSRGVDLGNVDERAALIQALDRSRAGAIEVRPLLASEGTSTCAATVAAARREIRNPADRRELIGWVRDADETQVDAALAAAIAGGRAWAQRSLESRAQILEQAASLFESHLPELAAWAVRESGKTLVTAVGEVREAVDSLRYYPSRLRAQPQLRDRVPLGTVACISPWNFPLAIFTGQVAAALAAGNAVIAKPAEQSCALALRATLLLHEAGVPAAALQLLPGDGERIGARLVRDARVAGVVFTGSTGVARAIARTLAERDNVPLIAETGGQNAMIVDSTALPEQVVVDVLRSAFDSAGQRCSALRLLCLQQEIAPTVLAMLQGAMLELHVGDPADIATDVGPLIDEMARSRVAAHVRRLQTQVRCCTPISSACEQGVFVAPTLIELHSVAELTGEVFGPVLHVLRFERAALDRLIDDINATRYGLTMGIASRVEGTVARIVERARVGNVYVNRNMIGAVVGLQPFGGQGLSGTGPKAGGPFYLPRLFKQGGGLSMPLTQAAGAPAPLLRLLEWLKAADDALLTADERQKLVARAQIYAHGIPLETGLSLAGYVGESDVLWLRPRGVLRATARSMRSLLTQLAAALASGNTLIVDEAGLAAQLRAALPAPLCTTLQSAVAVKGAAGNYQAVLVDATEAGADPPWWLQLRREAAAADGPIVPVLIGQPDYALEPLLREQTVTVNTAAVGGDVRLLALQEES
jgi:RHH-type proline utilization regulon transcriptional repressor/proline dehydrogenase/delta 1-pyrroline-5-carboxylate dehydrogenase